MLVVEPGATVRRGDRVVVVADRRRVLGGDDDVLTDLSGAAFAVVLVWELTYSGFIVTPPGARTA